MDREGSDRGEQKNSGGRGMKADISKGLRGLRGGLEEVKGRRHEGDGRGYILEETVWKILSFPKKPLK